MSKKTQLWPAISWVAGPRDDWNGVELLDPVSGDVHVTISTTTPEALALIVAAPKMLAALEQMSCRIGPARRRSIALQMVEQLNAAGVRVEVPEVDA